MTNEELAVKIQNGEQDWTGVLWEQNIGLFYQLSFKLYSLYRDRCASSGVDLEDIIQVSYFALCDAVQAFEVDGEYKLTTYIKYPLLNHFRALVGLRTSKRDPLDHAASLNKAIDNDESDTEHIDLLADPESIEPFEGIIDDIFQSELHDALETAICKLPKNRATVIRKRWLEGKQQGQIAAEMGTSYQYVHSLEVDALRKLRREHSLQIFHDEVLSNLAYKHTGLQWFKDTVQSSVEWAVNRAEAITDRKKQYGTFR